MLDGLMIVLHVGCCILNLTNNQKLLVTFLMVNWHMQGFLPIEASVLEVEVWGLGGRAVKDTQTSYKNREQLFTEQRRKVL